MFSDSKAPRPGERRGLKPHTPHFFPWLRNGLKPHHGSDLGLGAPFKRCTKPRKDLTPLQKPKEPNQEKEREKNNVPRCNSVGLVRRLPVVLSGRHALPVSVERQREDSPARWSQSPELAPNSETESNPIQDGTQDTNKNSMSVQDFYSEFSTVRTHGSHLNLLRSQTDGTSTPLRKYGPLLVPVPALMPPRKYKSQEPPNLKLPLGMCTDEERDKRWNFARRTYQQRDPDASDRINAQGRTDGEQGFRSSFSPIKEQIQNSHGQRSLTGPREQPVEGVNGRGSLNGVAFSTELPQTGVGLTRILRGSRKPKPSSEYIPTREQNQSQSSSKEAGQPRPSCTRRVVRNQIKRVVDNLEVVLGALKDVQQEMKEVVEQIDYLTSSIDLNEDRLEERGGGGGGGDGDGARPPSGSGSHSSSASRSSGVTVGSVPPKLSDQDGEPGRTSATSTLKRGHLLNYIRNQVGFEPASRPLHAQNTVMVSPEKRKTLCLASSFGSSSKRGRPPSYPHKLPSPALPAHTGSLPRTQGLASSPCRSSLLPIRPPAPGLFPLTVNLASHDSPPGVSPGLGSHSPGPSPPLPILSVQPVCQTHQTPHGDHPSVSPLSSSSSQPPASSRPPRDTETLPQTDGQGEASSTGLVQLAQWESTTLTDTTKTTLAQGRRGRKPPPYPHNRLFECVKKTKEPRKAPPYPEKRRLLSTTV